MEYEETPIIEPIAEPAPFFSQPKRPSLIKKIFGFIGNLLLFTFLFIVGVFLGAMFPQFAPEKSEQQQVVQVKTPATTPTPTIPLDPKAFWTLNEPYRGVSYKLPADVLAPVCDGSGCASKGTYLPGGTRFTESIRATSLSFMQKAIITDVAGRPFSTREATVSGLAAIEYTGVFRGTTTGGYTFSQMRGFMIQVTNTQTLELNHFVPAGITVDFKSDDMLFDAILETVKLSTSP